MTANMPPKQAFPPNMIAKVIGIVIILAVILYAVQSRLRMNTVLSDAEDKLNRGIELCKSGDFEAGLQEMRTAVALAHRRAQQVTEKGLRSRLRDVEGEGHYWRGVFLLRQAQVRHAEDRQRATRNRQTFRLPQEELKPAEDALRQCLALKPGKADALRLLAYIYRERGQTTKAIQTLEKAVSEREDFAEALNDLGEAYYMAKQYDRARENFEKAIIADDELASAHLNLGMFYFFDDRRATDSHVREKAARHLDRFLDLAPPQPNADTARAREMLSELNPGAPADAPSRTMSGDQ